ncbi:MAG: TIGR00153 family protein [Gammaproteobacteria bacterium]
MASSYLSGIFGGSPVKPLQQHMEKVHACVEELVPYVEAALAKDLIALEEQYETIATLEREADDLKNELRVHMPNRMFMPVSRSDLLNILQIQDKIAGKAKDIAGLMLGRQMQIPDAIADDFLLFVKRNIDCCTQACTAINELDELVGTGFVQGVINVVEDMLNEIDDIEHETDIMQIKIRAKLYEIEKNLNPVDVIFLYKIIDLTGDIADGAERVGNRLQLMLGQ